MWTGWHLVDRSYGCAGGGSLCRVRWPQLRQALRNSVLWRLQLLLQTQHQKEHHLRLHRLVSTSQRCQKLASTVLSHNETIISCIASIPSVWLSASAHLFVSNQFWWRFSNTKCRKMHGPSGILNLIKCDGNTTQSIQPLGALPPTSRKGRVRKEGEKK